MLVAEDIEILNFFGLDYNPDKPSCGIINFIKEMMDKVFESLEVFRDYKSQLDAVHQRMMIDKNEIYELCYKFDDCNIKEYIVGNFDVVNFNNKDIDMIHNKLDVEVYFNCENVCNDRNQVIVIFNRVDIESDNAIKKYEDLYIYLHDLSMKHICDGI